MVMFIFMLVIMMSLLCVMVNNVIVWWSVFLLMTLIFCNLNKSIINYSTIFNYFVLQESLGLIFLLLAYNYVQLMIVFLKIGVAPLHFWIFSVTNGVFGFNLMWFLTFQKLPFLLVMLQMMMIKIIVLLLAGLLVCLMQMLLIKSYKNLLILSSTESFNWLILGFVFSFLNVMMIFFYYFLMMLILIPKFNFNLQFLSWETTLVFLNLPFSVNFFVKVFSLSEVLKYDSVWILLLLFMMFLSVLSLSFWLVNLSVNVVNKKLIYNNLIYFILPLMLILLI
uniref:NADH dehydrogenase subunit 2 n=1 Tax=Teladorsagia circumcincta TaxID=45464 RepID=D3J8B0_TELCI|nr:NADH dehydrogenase subunit 2 [Teladorsagia circumcincta]ACX85209.1 NADH dehydrogenase subunit 2 [Teladorsagia circumcincta]